VVDSRVLGRLVKWQEKAAAPLELIEFYRSLLEIQDRAQERITIPALGLSDETIHQRLEHGRPVIGFDELRLDWPLVQDIFFEVTSLFAQYPNLFGPLPAGLANGSSQRKPSGRGLKA